MQISLSSARGKLDVSFPEIENLDGLAIRDLKSRLMPFLDTRITCEVCLSTSTRFRGEMVIETDNGLYLGNYTCLDCGQIKRLDGCFDPKELIWGRSKK